MVCWFSLYRPFTFVFYNQLETSGKVFLMPRERKGKETMNQMPVVQLQHATKRIGNRNIVADLSFDIAAGEIFGFLGPNGAGKTTTIRMMVGLVKISQGDILIKGQSITKNFNKAIRHVGAIVENPDLYKYLTGYQNLKHYARWFPALPKSASGKWWKASG
jgi:ABC-2 type transport system ATP-binding protein